MGKVFHRYQKPTQTNPNLVISRDFTLLHPIFRTSAGELIRHLNEEGIPFGLYEGFRSPARQDYLYRSSLGKPGNLPTYPPAWHSYHQYGLAGDFVPLVNGEWKWTGVDVESTWWTRLIEVGEEYGLESIPGEKPHLQLAGFSIADLREGRLPGGGDESWWKTLDSWRTYQCRA